MTCRAAILGATGYTGAELLRILLGHPGVTVTELVGHGKAGLPVATVLPSFAGILEGDIAAYDPDRIASRAEVAFLCLPHGASAKTARDLRARGLRVFDLSADFRLRDPAVHAEWYGHDEAPELRASAVYGQAELFADAIRTADLVAVPGCYPTATVLALAPILRRGLAEPGPIVVDAKSGVSGVGRQATDRAHFPETAEGFRAYKTGGSHRHTPEIEQALVEAGGPPTRVSFVPHLCPMTRGILSSSYVRLREGVTPAQLTELAKADYAGSPSVHVMDAGACPDTAWVRGSNRTLVSYTLDARTGWLLAQGAIDNLIKGAAGQAVQCMNLRMGFAVGQGLALPALWP